jgi:D-amino-acid oxidase
VVEQSWAGAGKPITGLFMFYWVLTFRSGEIDPNLAHRIAVGCVALAPELTDGKGTVESLDIVSHNVGLRPSRKGGPRLEAEHMDAGLVIHNYGSPFS